MQCVQYFESSLTFELSIFPHLASIFLYSGVAPAVWKAIQLYEAVVPPPLLPNFKAVLFFERAF